MTDQIPSRSAVNKLFGPYSSWRPDGAVPYLARRPCLAASRGKLLTNLIALSASLTVCAAMVVLESADAVFGHGAVVHDGIGAGFMAVFGLLCWAFWGDAIVYGLGGDKAKLPRLLRPLFSPLAGSYDTATLKVLDGIWTLRETIDELDAARRQLDGQRSDRDRACVEQFSEQARAALERGDRDSARSLLVAKAEAQEHAVWLDGQIAQIDEQLKSLLDREFHLKTLLAVRHMQRDSVAAQTRANTARAAIAESALLGDLDIAVELAPAALPRLTGEALEAEARALANEELLALEQAPAAPLDPAKVDRELAGLMTEVQISRSAAAA